ncbi:MAG TPA: glutaminyl-peptide cyclotransferase [Pseudomonadales bacterium]|nr:glutaminyl-peptide cyclotransferase [Pseudomonadales bacterium]
MRNNFLTIIFIRMLIGLSFLPVARADVPLLQWQLLRTMPREPEHFTEGLVFAGGQLFESTGGVGQSRLFAFDAENFSEKNHVLLPPNDFGEGLAYLDNTLYQLTWQNREVRVYDMALHLQRVLPFDVEGWGLTSDGKQLVSSDGSDQLVFRDAKKLLPLRAVTVVDAEGQHRDNLNELEWVDGKILANVWHRDVVLVINPDNGRVLGQYDFEKLSQAAQKQMPARNGDQVLNGLAWNPATQTLLVTGKDWPMWFEVRLVNQSSAPKSR